jgi:hypothetical protein
MTLYWFCNTCKGWYRTIPPYYEYEDGECFECCVCRLEGWKGRDKPCDYSTRKRK